MAYITIFGSSGLVYVDESGVNREYRRSKYRSKRGVRLHWEKPGKRVKKVNVIAGLRNREHVAVRCYEHATNSSFFEDWFEWELLAAIPEFSLVVLDNASFHREKQLRAIAAKYNVGVLFLPSYSPDLNLIEKSWANLKHWLIDNACRFYSLDFAIEYYFSDFAC